jgi:glycosyltransferase involved in cell wall biosynthesis
VTVYCEGDGKKKLSDYKGVELVYIPSLDLGPFSTILFDLRCLWHARKGFDVVYMLGYGAALFCFLPRLWDTMVWINMDGIEWAREKWSSIAKIYLRIMEAFAVRVADRIIADAEGIQEFLQQGHSSMAPCSVIPYGAHIVESMPSAVLREYGLRPKDYYLIVCRLEPENHVLEILQSFASSKSACKLIVVGNDVVASAYVKKLKMINDKRIRFIGVVYEPERLLALRYHCKAYLHGHSVGGTNPSLLEALGCGNPVIAHDNVFNRETAGSAGIFFKTNEDITRCIHWMDALDDDERYRLSSIARQRIRERYNWEMVTDQYIQLLRNTRNNHP